MKRSIVAIDEEKCTGCGLCADACHEGAIRMADGKARLVSESHCDGLGACLPACPAGAIRIEEREADAFDKEAVEKHISGTAHITEQAKADAPARLAAGSEGHEKLACGCPGTHARALERKPAPATSAASASADAQSELAQWPCQIQLVPPDAPYFKNARLLVAADCTAYANANVHQKWMKGRVTLIGCPKLDDADYAGKLADILRLNDIQSLTILRMSVPCCGGIVSAAKRAMQEAGVMIPWQVLTIGTNGEIIE